MRAALILCALLVLAACSAPIQEVDTNEGPSESDLDPELHGTVPTDSPNPIESEDLYDVRSADVTYYADVTGFEARPDNNENYPGVVLIHEWWGLNDNIKQMATKLAAQGYHVIAVDLYNGEVATTPEGARELVTSFDQEAGVENMQAAVDYLESQGSERIGSWGWCFGGARSLDLAKSADLDATVIYYGSLTTDAESLSSVNEPVLGIFGAEDTGIPVSDVNAFSSQLDAQGTQNAVHIYEGAGHAFANPSGDRFKADAAQDAWDKTIAFLNSELSEPTESSEDVVELSVQGGNFYFEMDGERNPDIVVQQGQTVRVTFESVEGFHDFVIDELDVQSDAIRSDDGAVTVEFVADQAGEFEYYCSIGSHRANGMEGNFIVE